jgi:pyridoxamine 5'-phosphate oxidase
MQISDIRKEYSLAGLKREDLDSNPILQFRKWFQQAIDAQVLEPNAMTLATADSKGRPSARTVLIREVDETGFTFFTNYESRKGRELAENPQGALVFFWSALERQVCISGTVSRLSREKSESYFKSRPIGNQLAALASRQSEVVASREILEAKVAKLAKEYEGKDIPLPSNWGGFVLSPLRVEFWQGRPSRLHDRFSYTRESNGNWIIDRLSP